MISEQTRTETAASDVSAAMNIASEQADGEEVDSSQHYYNKSNGTKLTITSVTGSNSSSNELL